MVYVVMGVSGSGKSTVGRLLAQRLGLPFHDADANHTPANISKMAHGIPLDDEDRQPWLEALAEAIKRWNRETGAVLACSALKEQYRGILSGEGREDVTYVFLHGPPELIKSRLQGRLGHYFPPALLETQLEVLEIPHDAISVDVSGTPDEICRRIIVEMGSRQKEVDPR